MASTDGRTGGCADLRMRGRDALDGAARREKPFAELSLPMAGEHNALNATAAAALAAGQGVPTEAIVEALATFKSVKRGWRCARWWAASR